MSFTGPHLVIPSSPYHFVPCGDPEGKAKSKLERNSGLARKLARKLVLNLSRIWSRILAIALNRCQISTPRPP
jgi:hypothetical protein